MMGSCEVLCQLGRCPKDNKERPECPDFLEEAEGVVALLTSDFGQMSPDTWVEIIRVELEKAYRREK